jgi:hypothetical protein
MRGNGRGPEEKGPMTGRGLGKCTRAIETDETDRIGLVGPRGPARGLGRGIGRGSGGRFGRRNGGGPGSGRGAEQGMGRRGGSW